MQAMWMLEWSGENSKRDSDIWKIPSLKRKLLEMEDQFLIGSNLLIKPITTKISRGHRDIQMEVYLGKTEIWYDFYSLKRIENHLINEEGIYKRNVDISQILVFWRGGSVIPLNNRVRRNTKAMKDDPYTLLVALDASFTAYGSLYIDDGSTYDYQHVFFCLIFCF